VLREQKVSSKSYNFFAEAIEFIAALEPELRTSIEQVHVLSSLLSPSLSPSPPPFLPPSSQSLFCSPLPRSRKRMYVFLSCASQSNRAGGILWTSSNEAFSC